MNLLSLSCGGTEKTQSSVYPFLKHPSLRPENEVRVFAYLIKVNLLRINVIYNSSLHVFDILDERKVNSSLMKSSVISKKYKKQLMNGLEWQILVLMEYAGLQIIDVVGVILILGHGGIIIKTLYIITIILTSCIELNVYHYYINITIESIIQNGVTS